MNEERGNILIIAVTRRELTEQFLLLMFPSMAKVMNQTILIASKIHKDLNSRLLHWEYAQGTHDFELKGLMLSKRYSFSHIVAFNEKDVLIAARLRSHLKISGVSYPDALIWRDKILMRERLKSQFALAKYAEVYSPTDVAENLNLIQYPFVLKPKRRGGAEGVVIVRQDCDLPKIVPCFSEFQEIGLVMEEYIQGELFQIDGFIYGDCFVAWPSAENPGTETGNRTLLLLPEGHPYLESILTYSKKLIKELYSFNTVFHLELFRKEDGTLSFLETACRFSGAGLVDLWKYAFGVNLSDLHFQIQAGFVPEDITLPKLEAAYGSFEYRPRNGTLKSVPDKLSIPHLSSIKNLEMNAEVGAQYNSSVAPNCAFCSGMIICDSYESWVGKCKEIIDYFDNNFIWE